MWHRNILSHVHDFLMYFRACGIPLCVCHGLVMTNKSNGLGMVCMTWCILYVVICIILVTVINTMNWTELTTHASVCTAAICVVRRGIVRVLANAATRARNINMYLYCISFLHTDRTEVVDIFPCVFQRPTVVYSQYHGCWWPGDAMSQGISNHDIDLVKPR